MYSSSGFVCLCVYKFLLLLHVIVSFDCQFCWSSVLHFEHTLYGAQSSNNWQLHETILAKALETASDERKTINIIKYVCVLQSNHIKYYLCPSFWLNTIQARRIRRKSNCNCIGPFFYHQIDYIFCTIVAALHSLESSMSFRCLLKRSSLAS